jgi:hypothetical protein
VSQTRFINPQTLSKPPGYTHVVEATAPEIPGSDAFTGDAPNRKTMIAFIVEHTIKVKEQTTSKQPDLTEDDFVPTLD